MDLANVGLKDCLIVSSLTGFLRTISMQIAGYKESDSTYWESYGTWAVSKIIAILTYATAMWLLRSIKKIGTPRESGKVAGSGDAEGRTAAQKVTLGQSPV